MFTSEEVTDIGRLSAIDTQYGYASASAFGPYAVATGGGTTPSVGEMNIIVLEASVTYTDFTHPKSDSQLLLVRGNNSTVLQNSATMRLAGATDYTFPSAGNSLILLAYFAGAWWEVSRSENQ